MGRRKKKPMKWRANKNARARRDGYVDHRHFLQANIYLYGMIAVFVIAYFLWVA